MIEDECLYKPGELSIIRQATNQYIEEAWIRCLPGQNAETLRMQGISIQDCASLMACDRASTNLKNLFEETAFGRDYIIDTPHSSGWDTPEGGHTVLTLTNNDNRSKYLVDITYKQNVDEKHNNMPPNFIVLRIATESELIKDLLRYKIREDMIELYLDICFPRYSNLESIKIKSRKVSSARITRDDYYRKLNDLSEYLRVLSL